MNELHVRVAVLGVETIVTVAGSHLLRSARYTFDVRPLLLRVLAEIVTRSRKIVEGEEGSAFGCVHRGVVLAYAGNQMQWQFGGFDGLERFDVIRRELVLKPARELLDVLTVDVVGTRDHVQRAVSL